MVMLDDCACCDGAGVGGTGGGRIADIVIWCKHTQSIRICLFMSQRLFS